MAEDIALSVQEKVVRRRQLFSYAFKPEVLEALEEWLGVKDIVFAFAPGSGSVIDPLMACRMDTLMGVVRGIRFEVAHLAEAEAALDKLRKNNNQ